MALVIPSDAHVPGDLGHTSDHDNIADVLAAVFPPWQFYVTAQGALGDGKIVVDGAMSSSVSPTTLTCATSAPFTAGDVGKHVMVVGAAAAGITSLCTTITGFTDSSHVTLGASCAVTVSGAQVLWSSDDTAAFQAAINAAVAWALAHSARAEVVVPAAPGAFYGIAGPLVTGGATLGNAQLTIPIIGPGAVSSMKISLRIRGAGDGSAFAYWTQVPAQLHGSTLVSYGVFASAGAQSTSVGAAGNPVVIGGPTQPSGYGTSRAPFPWYSNMCITLEGLRIVTPYSLNAWNYGGFDFSGIAQCKTIDLGVDVTTTYADTWQGSAMPSLVNGLSIGGLYPTNGNNDECLALDVTVGGGYRRALVLTEHTDGFNLRITYCYTALCCCGSYFGSVGASHAFNIGRCSIEVCANLMEILGAGQAGVGPIVGIAQLDTESGSPTFIDDGSSGILDSLGMIGLTGLFTVAGISIGPTGLQLINWQQRVGPVTAPGVPATTVAIQNKFWRWATVTLNGGTAITAVALGVTMGGTVAPTMTPVFTQASAALATVTIRVPPGGWISWTGTGSAPTWFWHLD